MPRRLPTFRLRVVAASAMVLTGLMLAACTPDASETPSPEPSSTAEPTAPATQEAPVLHPDGTAEDNLPLFAAVTDQTWAAGNGGAGRAYIDALVAAGFDRAAMQVTQDLTTVGNPVESLQFSVRWGEKQCLVGQVGPSTGEPVTIIVDQLAEARCLIGNTRPIDW